MILTCPNCATRYLVEDSELRAEGRKVRCSACGEEWRMLAQDAEAEGDLAEGPSDAPQDDPEPAEGKRSMEEDASLIVAPIATQSRSPRRAGAGSILGLILVVFIILAVGAFGFRREIVRMWPGTAPIYSAFGSPVGVRPPHG